MFKVEMSTDVEVVCPYREDEVDRYNVYVDYTTDPTVERMQTKDLTNLLEGYSKLEDGITGEDLAVRLFRDIEDEYPQIDKLEVYINTPYDIPENDEPNVRLYINMTNKEEAERA